MNELRDKLKRDIELNERFKSRKFTRSEELKDKYILVQNIRKYNDDMSHGIAHIKFCDYYLKPSSVLKSKAVVTYFYRHTLWQTGFKRESGRKLFLTINHTKKGAYVIVEGKRHYLNEGHQVVRKDYKSK